MTIVETWTAGTPQGKVDFKIKCDDAAYPRRLMQIREVPQPLSRFLGQPITALLGHLSHKFGAVHAKRVLIEEAAA